MGPAVDQPIINHPYHEPTRWRDYQHGQPVLKEGRGRGHQHRGWSTWVQSSTVGLRGEAE